MQTPIKNPVLTVQNPKKTNFSIFETNPPGPFKFEKYVEGPNKGFYKRVPPVLRDGKPLVYTKAYFSKPIQDLYKEYLPLYKGFYYVPRSSIPIRRLIFGLQNYDVPSTGNIEEFFKKFYSISVPNTFCPLIDPCEYDWCKSCQDMRVRMEKMEEQIIRESQRGIGVWNIFYLIIFIGVIAFIVSGAFM